jgi:hypothetical protein
MITRSAWPSLKRRPADVNIRLMGLDEECQAAIGALRQVFRVVQVRGPYENRDDSELVRYYVETRDLR